MLFSCAIAAAEENEQRVFDNAELFTVAQTAELEKRIASFRNQYRLDFVIVTNYNHYSGSAESFADEYYDKGDFGVGAEKSGALFLIDMYDSAYHITTRGDAIDYLTGERLDEFKQTVQSALRSARRSGDYASAAASALACYQSYVRAGIPEGEYRYDVITGQRLTSRHRVLEFKEILISLGLAALIGFLVYRGTNSNYNLHHSTYSYDFQGNSQVQLNRKQDTFLRTEHRRIPKPEPPRGGGGFGGGHSGGAGVHTSSGGVTHGGGGGHF